MQRSCLVAVIGVLLAGGPGAAQPDHAATLRIEQPWARETAPAQVNGAAYLVVKNGGSATDRLLGVSAGVAERAELHSHTIDAQGIATMRPAPAFEVPAGGEARLQPGGTHIMLIGLKTPLVEGTSFPLSLRFERAGTLEVTVRVESMRGTGGAAHKHRH